VILWLQASDIHWLSECFWSIVRYQRMNENGGQVVAVKKWGPNTIPQLFELGSARIA